MKHTAFIRLRVSLITVSKPSQTDELKTDGHRVKKRDLPSSLHSSGGFAFFASRGSNQDVVLVL